MPKQFLPLVSERSLLQEAVLRLEGIPDLAAPIVVGNHEHRFLLAEQIRAIAAPPQILPPQVLLLEPLGRNTAPALASAALYLREFAPGAPNDDALLLVLSSDQVIADVPAFHHAIANAARAARAGYLVTFGIVPTQPETGYGYIERGAAIEGEPSTFHVARFVEKPDEATAQKYVESGRFLWNSGMFLFSVEALLHELGRFQPEVLRCCREALRSAQRDADFYRLEENAFAAAPSISIDYAVMEKTERAAVVPADIGWNDLGSWSSLWEYQPKGAGGNVAQGDTFLFETHNSYVRAEGRFVATVGVEDLVVVETADAVLVVHKDRAQDVKKVSEWLQQKKRIGDL